jgi:hypothetical protein
MGAPVGQPWSAIAAAPVVGGTALLAWAIRAPAVPMSGI